jgi:PLP dependent protein
MSTVSERAKGLLAEIRRLEAQYGRTAGSVTLIGISKAQPSASVREAWHAGLRHFGESYVQEALPKIAALNDLAITWHFVGRIQSNKTAAIATRFDWVHGVDRLRIAERLNAQRPAHLPPLECCIEVSLGGQQTKGGIRAEQLDELAAAMTRLPRLRLRGLMTLPGAGATVDEQRLPFAELARLLARLRLRYPHLDTLSMGMSADIEAAIAEGATLVRIGTALFGERQRETPPEAET